MIFKPCCSSKVATKYQWCCSIVHVPANNGSDI
jgi:hypothetical protein